MELVEVLLQMKPHVLCIHISAVANWSSVHPGQILMLDLLRLTGHIPPLTYFDHAKYQSGR